MPARRGDTEIKLRLSRADWEKRRTTRVSIDGLGQSLAWFGLTGETSAACGALLSAMTQRTRRVATLLAVVLVGTVAVGAWLLARSWVLMPVREQCAAAVADHEVTLDLEQAGHAATIAAVALQRGLPARAVTIALAAALQESGLRNLDYGDRDSLGLFQQRPSQGWGTDEQVQDPHYAAGAFYDELIKIPDYRELEITDAAQRVQRSAFPDAYVDHEQDARVLASALSGNSPAALRCTVRLASYGEEEPGAEGLTPRAAAVLDGLRTAFGDLGVGGFDPEGIDSGHIAGSAHYDGRAVDVFFRPSDDPERIRAGWSLAHWLVVHADVYGITTVIYDDRIWTAARSDEGWRPYVHPSGDTTNPTLRHLDHVHVDVAR